ncbi:immune inhibitor A domain-containing protein [Nocardioides sp.]|uniref:immune inhibitor A domain-containing protein n=1 Tax=Nocardioides sp. TaxID=35761 RepID=UPI002ED38577
MRSNRLVALATASLVGAAILPLTAGQVGASPAPVTAPAAAPGENPARGDSLEPPAWKKRYDDVRKAAIEQRLRTGGKGASEKLSRGVFGKVATTGTEKIFVVLAEFGDTTHSAFPDGDSNATTFDGPVHNAIPKPNRKKDNSTLWQANYGPSHYQDMYFNRMRKFYENESSGRYSIDGTVTEWVKVPFNEARYGRDYCGGVACNNTWFLVRDALAYWVEAKLAAGWTLQQTTDYLRTFDELDRYDFDDDGNFKEPDGYIDHFQIVHAGQDAADGDPIYGDDAIWSHRWNAQIEPAGTGPVGGAQIGGVEVGMGGVSDPGGANVTVPSNRTGVWVNDYTIQPENGGLSVFAHEFAHDLDLPDLYDTSGNTGGAENSVGFWSLMSQSRGTLPKDDGIGDQPMPMGAWDKFQLGWLDYDLIHSGDTGTFTIRPAQSADTSATAEGTIVLLPNKVVPLELGAPCDTCGSSYFYSDSGNDLDNTMGVEVAGGGALTAKVNYEIEAEWDYAFLEASSDGGTTWTPVMTNLSDSDATHPGHNQSGFNNSGAGLTGSTGGWTDLTATVPDDTNALRFRYRTDGAAVEPGFQVDNVTLSGTEIGTAETDEGWEFDGFRITTGSEEVEYLNAYMVQNRQYVNLDKTLNHLYNFAGYADRPDWVDWFRYDPGALISYWDSSVSDNNVGDHPGSGLVLPVDAHPVFDHAPDGTLLRPRIASRDSAFGLARTKTQSLHHGGVKYTLRGRAAQPLFDDLEDWWFDSDEHSTGEHEGRYQPGWYSVDVPKTGTTIRVVKVNKKTGVVTIRVGTSG